MESNRDRKRYYTVRAAAAETGVPDSTLRYWETVFAELRPGRTRTGHRRYTQADIAMARRIRELLHERKLTIEGARAELRAVNATAPCRCVECKDRAAALELLSEALRGAVDARAAERIEAVVEWIRRL